ncbi:MAG: glycosyltransferase family 2 protein [Syntrophobacterales bacterium]|nr:glycosyltransferase family 2 protein [Syntrophobacterales bacterium]
MDISIIIVNWNTRELLKNCIASIKENVRGLACEIIVVDNASADGSVAMLREEFPEVVVIENSENRGFGAANNQALRIMRGRYALLLNSDTVLCEHAVDRLFACMGDHPDAAMVCGQLLNADGSKQNSIASFPNLFTLLMNTSLLEYLFPARFPSKRYNHKGPLEVDSCIGACLMVRKQAIYEVGMFDERYFFFFEETDWALAMRKAGWKSYLLPEAQIYHLQGQSIGGNIKSRVEFYRSRYQFFRKWKNRPVYLLLRFVIVVRLFINWVLTTCGTLLTLGLNRELRDKFVVYGKLLAMHLMGGL